MDGIVNYWGFLIACILLNLTPGSNTIYIENTFLPFILLGLTFLSTSIIWVTMLVLMAAPLGNFLRNNVTVGSLMNKICGSIFIGLAVKIGLEQ